MGRFDVVRYGTDTSDRPILMTRYMRSFWNAVCKDLGFEPTIVQGSFMARVGGGASASAGYHDKAGALDLRVWDLSRAEAYDTVRTCRRFGAAAYIRDDKHGGMSPHIHLTLGGDRPMDDGLAWAWSRYVAGRDGLASDGPDYHWRPDPLITEFSPELIREEEFMGVQFDNKQELREFIIEAVKDANPEDVGVDWRSEQLLHAVAEDLGLDPAKVLAAARKRRAEQNT